MTDINHTRKNRKPVNQRYPRDAYTNGNAHPRNKIEPVVGTLSRIGKTDFLDKSMRGWAGDAPLSDRVIAAGIANDFTDGHRGMARSVKGAKKFVRTRIRFHENAATKRLASAQEPDDGDDGA